MRETYSGIFGESFETDTSISNGDTDRQRVSGFLEHWGWEYNIDQCAQNERITWDDVYMWNVTRFLNKISYLKDKGKFEIALNGHR